MKRYKKRKKPRYEGVFNRAKYSRGAMNDLYLMANAVFRVRTASVVAFEEACRGYALDKNDVIESLMDQFVKDINNE